MGLVPQAAGAEVGSQMRAGVRRLLAGLGYGMRLNLAPNPVRGQGHCSYDRYLFLFEKQSFAM